MKSGEGKGMSVGGVEWGLVKRDFHFICKHPFLLKTKETASKYIYQNTG